MSEPGTNRVCRRATCRRCRRNRSPTRLGHVSLHSPFFERWVLIASYAPKRVSEYVICRNTLAVRPVYNPRTPGVSCLSLGSLTPNPAGVGSGRRRPLSRTRVGRTGEALTLVRHDVLDRADERLLVLRRLHAPGRQLPLRARHAHTLITSSGCVQHAATAVSSLPLGR